jgi:Na+/melibiose symporter-like transporter
MTQYVRARQRNGPVPLSTKIYQGIGALPDSYKTWAFNTFLLIYYNQVLGLSASSASVAIMIALIVDALFDPFVGSYSDNLRTRFGRRHPLMYASVLPLAVALYLLFTPPSGLSETGLFAWLTVFAVGTRMAMAFFIVPWSALFAEFSDDYVERSQIVTYRHLCGWIGGVTFTTLVWSFVFPTTPATPDQAAIPGQLNAENYALFAPVLAICVAIAAFLTTYLTRREVPYLLQPVETGQRFGVGQVFHDLKLALGNRDYLVLVIGVLGFSAIAGANTALEIYMQTYFWGLLPEDIRWFAFAIIGTFAAFVLVTPLQRRFDKKQLLIGTLLVSLVNGMLFVGLRFADVLPPNGSPLLLPILVVYAIVGIAMLTIALIMFSSMIADLLDAQELETGKRQEGMFSAALSLATKATSGLGLFFAGLILQYVIHFPTGVRPTSLDPGIVTRLGVVAGIVLPIFYVIPLYLISRYRLTRARHAEIQAALVRRRNEATAAN